MRIPYVLRNPLSYARAYMKFKLGKFVNGSKLGRAWIDDHCPMLVDLKKQFIVRRPLEGISVGVCLPGTWESLMSLSVLEAGGALLFYYPMLCRPKVGLELLRNSAVELFGDGDFGKRLKNCDFVYDSTAFLGKVIVKERFSVKGIIEQTATGVSIYRDFDAKGLLHQPVLDLDGSHVKRVGENEMATGLGLVEALLKLHLFLPDKHVLLLGFGSVGSGCASYLKRLGCNVAVFDIESDKIAEAEDSGYTVGALEELLEFADIVINATGSLSPVLRERELQQLKNGAILANMGGFGWDRTCFRDKEVQALGGWVDKVFMGDGAYVYELAKGLPVNFVLASGTDTETMDMVFSLGCLSMEYLARNYEDLPSHLLPIPEEVQKRHLELAAKLSARKAFWRS